VGTEPFYSEISRSLSLVKVDEGMILPLGSVYGKVLVWELRNLLSEFSLALSNDERGEGCNSGFCDLGSSTLGRKEV